MSSHAGPLLQESSAARHIPDASEAGRDEHATVVRRTPPPYVPIIARRGRAVNFPGILSVQDADGKLKSILRVWSTP